MSLRGVAQERTRTGGRVGASDSVAKERISDRWPCSCRRLCSKRALDNHWLCCRCRLSCLKRIGTSGRVPVAGCVALKSDTPVAVFQLPVVLNLSAPEPTAELCNAGRVAKERIRSRWPCWLPAVSLKSAENQGCVADPLVRLKSALSLSRVATRIAAVWWRRR